MLLTASAFLLAFVLLFSFRAHDTNTLFSWTWMFSSGNGSWTYLLLIAALTGAFLLSLRSFPERYDVLLLFVFPFAAVLPFWGEPEIIVDASRYFTQAKHLAQGGAVFFVKEWGRNVFAWTDLPLVPFCYGILFKLFGESR